MAALSHAENFEGRGEKVWAEMWLAQPDAKPEEGFFDFVAAVPKGGTKKDAATSLRMTAGRGQPWRVCAEDAENTRRFPGSFGEAGYGYDFVTDVPKANGEGDRKINNSVMRASIVSLLLTVFLTAGATWYYFRHAGLGTADGKGEVISTTGVKLDLATIAHAEQAYYSLHGSYGKLDQLDSTGVVDKTPTGRDGFVYAVDTTHDGFLVTASRKDSSGHTSRLMMDNQMKVREELTEE